MIAAPFLFVLLALFRVSVLVAPLTLRFVFFKVEAVTFVGPLMVDVLKNAKYREVPERSSKVKSGVCTVRYRRQRRRELS